MGWFDEQIRQRKDNDKDVFSEALFDIVGAVSGKKLFVNINDNRKLIKNEIDEILKFYHHNQHLHSIDYCYQFCTKKLCMEQLLL